MSSRAHRAIATVTCLLASLVALLRADGSPYRILIYSDGEVIANRVGVLVAEELILTATELIAQGDRIEVVDSATGAHLIANLYSSTDSFTLLSVQGLKGRVAHIATQPPTPGESLHLLMVDGTRREGILHARLDPDSAGSRAYQFSMVVRPEDVGTPVMNSCGDLVAVSWGMISLGDSTAAVPVGLSGTLPAMITALDRDSVRYEVADTPCLSVEEQLEQEKEVRVKLEAKRQDLEETLRTLQGTTQAGGRPNAQELAALNQQMVALEDQLAATTAELATQDSIIAEKTRLQAELESIREEYDSIQAELASVGTRSRRRLLLLAILSVLLLGSAVMLLLGAARRRSETHQQLIETADRLREAEAENVRKSATYSDVLLSGQSQSGDEIRVKLSGTVLAQSTDGIILGRSSTDAGCVITEGSVSRKHARIRIGGRGLEIEDLGSLNGTLVNGIRLTPGSPYLLPNGAVLAIGDVDLTVTELIT